MSTLRLEIEGLEAWYGRAQVLHGVSLSVAAGEVVALLGRNGAGKSTTLEAVLGLVRARRGGVRFEGKDIFDKPTYALARMGLGWVPEDRRVFPHLTVAENLEVGRQPARPGLEPWTEERLYALFPNLAELRDRPAGRMSGGEQQMLAIGRTLMGNPALILLDEPSEGLAPRIVEQMAEALLSLKGQGLSVLLSEQNLPFARKLADRAAVIETGRIVWEGTLPALDADHDARHRYLAV